VGARVYAEPYADVHGTVTAVDAFSGRNLIQVVWDDGDGGAIVYPAEASFLKLVRKLPWQ
jgi:hypothetical protein